MIGGLVASVFALVLHVLAEQAGFRMPIGLPHYVLLTSAAFALAREADGWADRRLHSNGGIRLRRGKAEWLETSRICAAGALVSAGCWLVMR